MRKRLPIIAFSLLLASVLAMASCTTTGSSSAASSSSASAVSASASTTQENTTFPWFDYAAKEESWWQSSEAQGIATQIVQLQQADGGWQKYMDLLSEGEWSHSTFDNNATWGHVRFLAKAYTATNDDTFKASCVSGIEFILNSQYENGGWPQIVDTDGTYHAHITFNDGAMTEVMNVLDAIMNKSSAAGFGWIDDDVAQRARAAFERGMECILQCQNVVDGTYTIWCQQYDEKTLEPTTGRAYELPSNCTRESVQIIKLLQRHSSDDPRLNERIVSALSWLHSVMIRGKRFEWVGDDMQLVDGSTSDVLWARFYDLETNVPLFCDRDGNRCSDVMEIDKERRTNYEWYGTWPASLLAATD